MKRNFLIAFAVALSVALGVYLYRADDGAAALRYSLEPVTRGDVESVVVTTGTLEALNTIVVGSQLSGQVAELHADFNDPVAAQQLVARIDPRTFEARVRQNRADVKVARASIAQREAEVLGAAATLAQAERELARRDSLRERGHVSESELDADLTAVETAQAQLNMAEAAVINSQAVLEQRQAALNQAEVDLERTYIRSPVSGTVINRTVEIGQTVAASLQAPELFLIAQDLHQMKVEASVDEADIGRIAEDLPVRFSVDAYPDRQFGGQVQQIRKAPDRIQNVVTYRVIIAAANDDLALLPGMTASVEVVLGQKQDVLRVPNSALRFTPKSAVGGAAERGGIVRGDPTAELARLKSVLALDDGQVEQIEALLTRQQARMREIATIRRTGNAPEHTGASREAFRQARQNVNTSIRGLLTAEQRQRFDAMQSERGTRLAGARPATVWVLEDGQPVARNVLVGLADDELTEVIRGLAEGDSVIVRATRATG